MVAAPHSIPFVEPAESLGACHPLVEQLGLAGSMLPPDAGEARPVRDAAELRVCLRAYQHEHLLPVELPAIRRAWRHATHNEFRELAAYDRSLAAEPRLAPFASASQRTGQLHLRRFRPLADVRLVQRYLHALEREEVYAWHTLVYGVTLWLFSLPLHQGLLGYARQVTRGLLRAAAPELKLSPTVTRELFDELTAPLLVEVPALVARNGEN